MLFAPYLNSAIESMNQKQFTQLLMNMILIFIVIPTVLYYIVLGEYYKYTYFIFIVNIHKKI